MAIQTSSSEPRAESRSHLYHHGNLITQGEEGELVVRDQTISQGSYSSSSRSRISDSDQQHHHHHHLLAEESQRATVVSIALPVSNDNNSNQHDESHNNYASQGSISPSSSRQTLTGAQTDDALLAGSSGLASLSSTGTSKKPVRAKSPLTLQLNSSSNHNSTSNKPHIKAVNSHERSISGASTVNTAASVSGGIRSSPGRTTPTRTNFVASPPTSTSTNTTIVHLHRSPSAAEAIVASRSASPPPLSSITSTPPPQYRQLDTASQIHTPAQSSHHHQQQQQQHVRQQPFPNPAIHLTPGTLRSLAGYFGSSSSPPSVGTSGNPSHHHHHHHHQQPHVSGRGEKYANSHHYHTRAVSSASSTGSKVGSHPVDPHLHHSGELSLLDRTRNAIASFLMVTSPRLPFYTSGNGADDSVAGSATGGIHMNGDATAPGTDSSNLSPGHGQQYIGRPHSPQIPKHSTTPSISFTGPNGLFSPAPGSSTRGLFSPSLFNSGMTSAGLPGSGQNTPNFKTSGPSGHTSSKRSFYKDKDESLYPATSKSAYDTGFRKSHAPVTTPGKTTVLRVPRVVARLTSRRGRLVPTIFVCCVLFFWALGSTRRSSLYDAAEQASGGQVGRLIEAADARVGQLNPMKWAKLRSGETEDEDLTLVRQNKSQRRKGKGKGKQIVMQKFDVESLDPAGPLAESGTVGSAVKRYASWEGGRRDGRILLQAGKPHPIPTLMARAKQRWHALKGRQSKTFAEAVREYQRRYGRMPPKGFDQWYAFAKFQDVQLIDEFNIIEDDFHMFRAFSGESFRARVAKLSKETDWMWDIKIEKGVTFSDGELKHHDRAKGVLHLIGQFGHLLPDLHIVYNGHDTARTNVGWEERMRLEDLVAHNEVEEYNATDTDMRPHMPSVAPGWGMPTICSAESAVRQTGFDYGFADKAFTGHEMPELPEGADGTVIDSFLKYMDTCDSPQYRHFHSSSSYVFPWHPGPTMPLFTAGVQSQFADIHCIITEQFGLESRHDPTWEEKPFDRLVWRGQTSGPLFDKGTAWRSSHRARLHILSHQEDGARTIAITDEDDNVKLVEIPNYQLNPLFLDTGFVGPPVQCIKDDGTCDEMTQVFNGFDPRLSFERASLYKYVLDVDGNSWSGRFPRLMATNAAVVKATIYREFWTDWCIPWLHFIPIQVDYSDLWDVMAFFRGGLGGEGAHDDLAKEIAIAGKNWAREHFRYEDMEVYTFRQYLEYARLWADDREAMTYSGEVEGYEPVWSAEEVV